MLAIKNACLVMRDHYIPNGVILMEDGIITDLGEAKAVSIPDGCHVYDAENYYVGPGFVDIHTHSDGYVFFTDDPVTPAQHHLHHGTTTVLPALYYSMNAQEYVDSIHLI